MRCFTKPKAADRLDLSASCGKLTGSVMAVFAKFDGVLRERIHSGVVFGRQPRQRGLRLHCLESFGDGSMTLLCDSPDQRNLLSSVLLHETVVAIWP